MPSRLGHPLPLAQTAFVTGPALQALPRQPPDALTQHQTHPIAVAAVSSVHYRPELFLLPALAANAHLHAARATWFLAAAVLLTTQAILTT